MPRGSSATMLLSYGSMWKRNGDRVPSAEAASCRSWPKETYGRWPRGQSLTRTGYSTDLTEVAKQDGKVSPLFLGEGGFDHAARRSSRCSRFGMSFSALAPSRTEIASPPRARMAATYAAT
jgi:hypothetical protein